MNGVQQILPQDGQFLLAWELTLQLAGIDSRNILSSSHYDPGRRVYRHNGNIAKLTLFKYQTTSQWRAQSLWGEFLVLKQCEGIRGIPRAVYWERDCTYEMLILTDIGVASKLSPKAVSYFHCLSSLAHILYKMALCGVSQNDLTSDNTFVGVDGAVYLIDFDQATMSTVPKALARSFLGFKFHDSGIAISMTQFLKGQIKAVLPAKLLSFLRRMSRRNQLPSLQVTADRTTKELLRAWEVAQDSDASAPGATLAYYSFWYGGYHFPGERSWKMRWDTIKLITEFSGKRILELGCNMALLSCHLLLQGRAESVLAVDIDSEILKSAKLVSSALDVFPEYMEIDFDSKFNWETDLTAFSPDIVFALNVLNWVKDKTRLMNFLGRFDQIIFEGHDSFEVERTRFENVGFKNIVLVSLTERNRPLMLCAKE